jgi:AraC-like DNA-binding protein
MENMETAPTDRFGTIPSATGGIARLACARLREAGKDVTDVLHKAGLSVQKVDDPTTRIEVQTEIKFLELAAEALCDDLFGFHLARSFDLREIGLVYYVMASSEQLTDALRNGTRYSRINNEGVRLNFNGDRAATLALDYVDVDRATDKHHMEFWLVALVRICRQVTDSRLAPRQLKIRHFRAGPPAEFKAFFGIDVEFGADGDEIAFSAPVASLPVTGRDVYLNKLLRQYADDALASRPIERPGTRANVERLIPDLLPHGKANVPELARRLGMSSRTLSRKLHDEQTAFLDLLDEMRASLAQRYLGERELPMSEIAWLLGYREVSSFTHAFRRWTGMTPRQFRSSTRRLGEAVHLPA